MSLPEPPHVSVNDFFVVATEKSDAAHILEKGNKNYGTNKSDKSI